MTDIVIKLFCPYCYCANIILWDLLPSEKRDGKTKQHYFCNNCKKDYEYTITLDYFVEYFLKDS